MRRGAAYGDEGPLLDSGDVDYVDDQDSAARLYLELHRQLGTPGLVGHSAETRRALRKLEDRWPGVGRHAAVASSEQLGGLSPQLKRMHKRVRGDHGVTAQTAATERRRAQRQEATEDGGGSTHGRPTGDSGRRQRGRAAPRARSGSARRAWQTTGVPSTTASWRDLGLQIVGFGLLASLAYVVLTDAENPRRGWPSVVQTAIGSLSTFVAAITRPVDPLRPHSPAPAPPGVVPRAQPVVNTAPNARRLVGYPDTPLAGATPKAPLFTNPLNVPFPTGG